MSNPAIRANEVFAGEADQRLSVLWRATVVAAAILILAVAANAWVFYLGGLQTPHARSAEPVAATTHIESSPASHSPGKPFDQWALTLTAVAALGGAGFLLTALTRFSRWQRAWASLFYSIKQIEYRMAFHIGIESGMTVRGGQ